MREAGEVVLEPSDVDDVQVVGRLIEEQDVGLEEHGTRERELHLPTTGQGADSLLLALVVEADGGESLDDLRLAGLDTLVAEDELQDRGVLLAAVDVVLDVEGADLVGRRETLDLAVRLLAPCAQNELDSTNPLVMARMRVDLPVPFLPQRP